MSIRPIRGQYNFWPMLIRMPDAYMYGLTCDVGDKRSGEERVVITVVSKNTDAINIMFNRKMA